MTRSHVAESRLVATQPVDNRAALCYRVSICAEGCLSGQLRIMPAGQKRLSIRERVFHGFLVRLQFVRAHAGCRGPILAHARSGFRGLP